MGNETNIAFMFINTYTGKENGLAEKLRARPGSIEVHVVYGVYDIVAKIKGDTPDQLKERVTDIRRSYTDEIITTLTTIVMSK
jgi:DNA-binding Lrp family transcriptional regulator